MTRYSQPVFSAVLHKEGHVADGKVEIKFKAWRARLSDLDQRLAPAVDVANKHVVFGHSVRRQILAKRRGAKQRRLLGELANPISIVFAGVMA